MSRQQGNEARRLCCRASIGTALHQREGASLAERSQTRSSEISSFAEFSKEFSQAAIEEFGSGWAWLVQRKDGSLGIEKASNAEDPLVRDERPLLCCDVWEHAYYIEYRNARPKYVEAFWHLVNWDFVASNMK